MLSNMLDAERENNNNYSFSGSLISHTMGCINHTSHDIYSSH